MNRPACRVDPATARRCERIRVLDRALRLVRAIAPVKRRKPQRARGDLGQCCGLRVGPDKGTHGWASVLSPESRAAAAVAAATATAGAAHCG